MRSRVSSDVIVSHVTFSSHELALRLTQKWRFLVIEGGKVHIAGEAVATFDKRGGTVRLTPTGPRECSRWVAWAIQEICLGAEAVDDQADPPRISEPPLTAEEVQEAAQRVVKERLAAIAKEADPAGGAQEAAVLISYLVKRGLLELAGPIAVVVRAVMPLLHEADDTIGKKLEDVLLDLDEVDELFGEADDLTKLVLNNDHIFDR